MCADTQNIHRYNSITLRYLSACPAASRIRFLRFMRCNASEGCDKVALSSMVPGRGIAKKSVCYKLFSSLLTKRLSEFLETLEAIPDEQHGFRSGRSTMSACMQLLRDVREALVRPRTFIYAVFVDFRLGTPGQSPQHIGRNRGTTKHPLPSLKYIEGEQNNNRRRHCGAPSNTSDDRTSARGQPQPSTVLDTIESSPKTHQGRQKYGECPTLRRWLGGVWNKPFSRPASIGQTPPSSQ